ncbi:MAG: ComF family protein [Bacteroidota bacterium]|nr:ComF family protein [Bacteroidota bacterium]
MIHFKEIKESVLHLLFPHICIGCGSDLVSEQSMLCLHCLANMPETNFHLHDNNPVEKSFWGRLPLSGATAQYYFTKESLIQHLMNQLKYRGNKDLGVYLGRLMGEYLKMSNRFSDVHALIPLPLFPAKEKSRGYNQATMLCEGLSENLGIPILKNVVIRPQHTETQTKKGRVERWENIEGKFELIDADAIAEKHVMLIDDVVTTGATLESCGKELLKAENTKLSIATLCYTAK